MTYFKRDVWLENKCATTPCHAEEAARLTKHLLPIHTVEAADSSTPLCSVQNDRAHLTSNLEVTHDVLRDFER